jgi:peroxiredoxin
VVKKHHLTFSVLGDPGNQVAAQFGLVYRLPDDLAGLYQQFGIDLKRFNGDGLSKLPMPGRFILDSRGTIINADVHPDYTKRPEPQDIVQILKSNG